MKEKIYKEMDGPELTDLKLQSIYEVRWKCNKLSIWYDMCGNERKDCEGLGRLEQPNFVHTTLCLWNLDVIRVM